MTIQNLDIEQLKTECIPKFDKELQELKLIQTSDFDKTCSALDESERKLQEFIQTDELIKEQIYDISSKIEFYNSERNQILGYIRNRIEEDKDLKPCFKLSIVNEELASQYDGAYFLSVQYYLYVRKVLDVLYKIDKEKKTYLLSLQTNIDTTKKEISRLNKRKQDNLSISNRISEKYGKKKVSGDQNTVSDQSIQTS